ncbi:MAG: hypothetical protein ACSHX0_01000 [Akkermansiaceae bacterium]
MRGSPPLQALILLVSLLLLGWLAKDFIRSENISASGVQIAQQISEQQVIDHTVVDAEIELTFSSLPLSYELRRYADAGSGAEISLLKGSSDIGNPSYHNVSIPSHRDTTYLLDVVWASEPEPDARHFVSIHISPVNGDPAHLSLISHLKNMEETFDYSTTSLPAEPKSHSHE